MFKLRAQYFLCVTTKCGAVPDKSARRGRAAPVPCVLLTHASRRAPAPWCWSQREQSSRCTGSFWWTPATRAPTWTWCRHSRWCWAGGWIRCEGHGYLELLICWYIMCWCLTVNILWIVSRDVSIIYHLLRPNLDQLLRAIHPILFCFLITHFFLFHILIPINYLRNYLWVKPTGVHASLCF